MRAYWLAASLAAAVLLTAFPSSAAAYDQVPCSNAGTVQVPYSYGRTSHGEFSGRPYYYRDPYRVGHSYRRGY